jgi:predicted nucleic acid-binding protein
VSFLVDTNVLSELRKRGRGNPNVHAWSEATGWGAFHTSWIAIAELRRGTELIRRHDKSQADVLHAWIAEVMEFLQDRIHPVDRSVAEIWADLMVPNPRSPLDMLIAATARSQGLTLVTRNIRDFTDCGVPLLNPWTYTRQRRTP